MKIETTIQPNDKLNNELFSAGSIFVKSALAELKDVHIPLKNRD